MASQALPPRRSQRVARSTSQSPVASRRSKSGAPPPIESPRAAPPPLRCSKKRPQQDRPCPSKKRPRASASEQQNRHSTSHPQDADDRNVSGAAAGVDAPSGINLAGRFILHEEFGKTTASKSRVDGVRVYLSNLGYGVCKYDLMALFSEIQTIKYSSINYDQTGKSLGTAEVVFYSFSNAVKAMKKFNHLYLNGKSMILEVGTSVQYLEEVGFA